MSRQISIPRLVAINAVVCGLEIAACVAFTFIPPLLLKVAIKFLVSAFYLLNNIFRSDSRKPTCPSSWVLRHFLPSSLFPRWVKCQTLVEADTGGGDPSSSPSPSSSWCLCCCSTSARAWPLRRTPSGSGCCCWPWGWSSWTTPARPPSTRARRSCQTWWPA